MEGWIEGDAKKEYGNCHLLAEPVCLTDDDFSLEEIFGCIG